MKLILLFSILTLVATTGWGQENSISLSGGYVFKNIEDADESATGWRLNFAYEFTPFQGKISHGLGVGYISTDATVEVAGQQTIVYDLNTTPIYYAPKFSVGKESLKGFLKGAIGIHFSSYEKTGLVVTVSDKSVGFYGGLGLGVAKTFNDKLFINLEYEWAYV